MGEILGCVHTHLVYFQYRPVGRGSNCLRVLELLAFGCIGRGVP
jgi:hypothetical protein